MFLFQHYKEKHKAMKQFFKKIDKAVKFFPGVIDNKINRKIKIDFQEKKVS